jgi:hypothetical protein
MRNLGIGLSGNAASSYSRHLARTECPMKPTVLLFLIGGCHARLGSPLWAHRRERFHAAFNSVGNDRQAAAQERCCVALLLPQNRPYRKGESPPSATTVRE